MCGELPRQADLDPRKFGSSPRVRGTPPPSNCHAAAERFIPACAGNSTTPYPHLAVPAVHPRVCGELGLGRAFRQGFGGSSPRVRGTRRRTRRRRRAERFIPACAGNSHSAVRRRHATPVHPRVCGELVERRCRRRLNAGSSPRVRGTRGRRAARAPAVRFIPACAGNSRPPHTRNASAAGSSPRVRGTPPPAHAAAALFRFIPACAGNSQLRTAAFAPATGSSPRVRGTRPKARHFRAGHRFIPACAGNSRTLCAARFRRPVHPRVCGELQTVDSRDPTVHGSSPRVRGTRQRLHGGHGRHRFIPACAGNSELLGVPFQRQSVHPRVCGELLTASLRLARVGGSSPRVRGTRRR